MTYANVENDRYQGKEQQNSLDGENDRDVRIAHVWCLTPELSRAAKRRRLERIVSCLTADYRSQHRAQ